ncbi:MAG TPA: ATP-grasp domain-containing protein, partial [Glycomyces sp.]|nr:ATP-grasp domain-containing protein [Glycomyces sp.]
YDTADRLYFEPLTFEDVTEVYQAEHTSGTAAGGPGVVGVVVQLGGQTPLGLAERLENAGLPVVGTSPKAIDAAEDRGVFGRLLDELGLVAPAGGTATSYEEARKVADEIGYPVLVRPSYVLGGRGMEIVYDEDTLAGFISRATEASPEHPILIDRFLDDAIEIDVDCLCDGEDFYLGGIMEHIEEAGVHSGDSSCALPPITLGKAVIEQIRDYTAKLAFGIGVRGLMNVQYALKDEQLYVLEANPRASRTVPFVSKATAVPLAKAAARIALGARIAELRAEGLLLPEGDGSDAGPEVPISVKEVLLPFKRFRTVEGAGLDAVLGPEMKSTGEVMGIDSSFGLAFAKATLAVYGKLPTSGNVFVSVADRDKRSIVFPVRRLVDLGFTVYATEGTGLVLKRHGIDFSPVPRHSAGAAEDAVSLIASGQIDLVITTPSASTGPRTDGWEIRSAAVVADVSCVTTIQGAAAATQAIESASRGEIRVASLQELHKRLRGAEVSV